MTMRFPQIDITDRANGKVPAWDATDQIHKYVDPSSSGVPAGTSFPGSPSANDLFYRTDRDLLYFYDGTRWLTTNLYILDLAAINNGSSNPSEGSFASSRVAGLGFDWYVEKFAGDTIITTTNDGTKFWTVKIVYKTSPNTNNDLAGASFTTAADSPTTHTHHSANVNAVVPAGAMALFLSAAKTSTPGNIFASCFVTYRLVG